MDLLWARGDYPTLYGTISVNWSFDCKGCYQIVVNAPAGTKGTIHLPSPLHGNLGVNGGNTLRYQEYLTALNRESCLFISLPT